RMTVAQMNALLAAYASARRGYEAGSMFTTLLRSIDQPLLGHFVLLAAAGLDVSKDPYDAADQYPDEPLAQYLGLYSSPALSKLASHWAAGAGVWSDGLMKRLALGHALVQRWLPRKDLPASRRQQNDDDPEVIERESESECGRNAAPAEQPAD